MPITEMPSAELARRLRSFAGWHDRQRLPVADNEGYIASELLREAARRLAEK